MVLSSPTYYYSQIMKKHTDLRLVTGDWLRKMRSQKGLTQERLSETAKISPNYYSEVERGRRNITIMSLQKIIEALNMTGEDVLDMLVKVSAPEDDVKLVESVAQLIKQGDSRAKRQARLIIKALLE